MSYINSTCHDIQKRVLSSLRNAIMHTQSTRYPYGAVYAVPAAGSSQTYIVPSTPPAGYVHHFDPSTSADGRHMNYGAFYVPDSSFAHSIASAPPTQQDIFAVEGEYPPGIFVEEHEPAPIAVTEQAPNLTRLHVSDLRRSPQPESPQDQAAQFTPRCVTEFPTHSTPTSSAASPGSASLSSVDMSPGSGGGSGQEVLVDDAIDTAPPIVPSTPIRHGRPKQDRKTIETKSRDKLKTALEGLKSVLTQSGMPGHQTSRKARFLMNATNFIRGIIEDRERLREMNRAMHMEIDALHRERDALAARLRMTQSPIAHMPMHGYLPQ